MRRCIVLRTPTDGSTGEVNQKMKLQVCNHGRLWHVTWWANRWAGISRSGQWPPVLPPAYSGTSQRTSHLLSHTQCLEACLKPTIDDQPWPDPTDGPSVLCSINAPAICDSILVLINNCDRAHAWVLIIIVGDFTGFLWIWNDVTVLSQF